jgi:hypothetical protein
MILLGAEILIVGLAIYGLKYLFINKNNNINNNDYHPLPPRYEQINQTDCNNNLQIENPPLYYE